MGEIRKITCQSCGRNWELQTGSGLRHGLLENVISAFPENLRKKIAGSMEDMNFRFMILPISLRTVNIAVR